MEPGKVEFRLFSGVVAYVTPLSPETIQMVIDLRNKIDEGWEKEFEKSVKQDDDEGGILAGNDVTAIDTSNPAYIARKLEVDAKRMDKFFEVAIDICVEFDRPREQLIKDFAPRISTMRKHLDLPDDDWQATLKHAILIRKEEWQELARVINQQTPITEVEIRDSMRIFQPAISRARLLDADRSASSVHKQPETA